jgi:hypothetical protein
VGLLICLSCGYQREMSPIPRKEFICGKCGCRHPRLIRREKMPGMIVGGDRDGIDPERARHQTFAGLKRHAEIKGYKPVWASMKFKELFRRWPNGESKEPPVPPSGELRAWIRRQNIAYAKSKGPRKIETPAPEAQSKLMTDDDWGAL